MGHSYLALTLLTRIQGDTTNTERFHIRRRVKLNNAHASGADHSHALETRLSQMEVYTY